MNFELPNEPESYVHRIGRTARAGADGIAISFCDGSERGYLRDIERLIRMKIEVVAHELPELTEEQTPPGRKSRAVRTAIVMVTSRAADTSAAESTAAVIMAARAAAKALPAKILTRPRSAMARVRTGIAARIRSGEAPPDHSDLC